MIKDILRGRTPVAQEALDELFNRIGDNPQILWYPSAGNDYRDIHEFYGTQYENNHPYTNEQKPTLFIHSDAHADWINLNVGQVFNGNEYAMGFNPPITPILIRQRHELTLIPPYNFNINPEYVHFNPGIQGGIIYLLDISIYPNTEWEINNQVIYFLFENMNFLEEVLLNNDIKVSHIVKIRDGYGMGGGGNVNHAVLRAFFKVLETKFFITDNNNFVHDNIEQNILEYLMDEYPIEIKNFNLEPIRQVHNWSGYNVDVCKINLLEEQLTIPEFFDNHY